MSRPPLDAERDVPQNRAMITQAYRHRPPAGPPFENVQVVEIEASTTREIERNQAAVAMKFVRRGQVEMGLMTVSMDLNRQRAELHAGALPIKASSVCASDIERKSGIDLLRKSRSPVHGLKWSPADRTSGWRRGRKQDIPSCRRREVRFIRT